MNSAASPPEFHPRTLVRWALFFPAAIFAWIYWQKLLARVFYDGVLVGGLTWVEGTAEAVFVLVAALIAPRRKREVAVLAFGFFLCRDIATILIFPIAGTALDAASAIGLAFLAAAIVWWATREA